MKRIVLIGLVGCAATPAVEGTATGPARPEVTTEEDAALDPPHGYYAGVDARDGASLRRTLHAAIAGHERIPYTDDRRVDTWDVLELADADPADPRYVIDLYGNQRFPRGDDAVSREHSWPKSYGFPDDVVSNEPYSDCHALFLVDQTLNASRNDKPYDWCSEPDCEPRGENLTREGTWETWEGRRGDVARALFYLDVRYEGGGDEPDLRLTDSAERIAASQTGENERVGYMGKRSVLLEWHEEDPVDARERKRNEIVFGYQGNRNPFVDHPGWVTCVYVGQCPP